jgi:hypothetical protein
MGLSFKFNEVKFCTLLINWLIGEKMFTYFYNKFRHVNHTHYIKFGVNSWLHNSGCCRRSVAPWITVLPQHTVFTFGTHYKFTLVWYSTKQGTTHSPTSYLAHLYTLPVLLLGEHHRQQHSWVDDFTGQCLLWQLSSHKTFFEPSAPDSKWVTATRISLSLIFPPWFVEGFGRWRGYNLAPQSNPDLQGSCSLASHCSLSDRSEQNSSKLWHTVCDIFRMPSAF